MYAHLSVLYPDELDCDFASEYGIYDRGAIPTGRAAVFAAGLPENSRTMMRAAGNRIDLDTSLLAAIADAVRVLCWQKTKDGAKGRNRPKSISEALARPEKPKELQHFGSGSDFERAAALLRGSENNG